MAGTSVNGSSAGFSSYLDQIIGEILRSGNSIPVNRSVTQRRVSGGGMPSDGSLFDQLGQSAQNQFMKGIASELRSGLSDLLGAASPKVASTEIENIAFNLDAIRAGGGIPAGISVADVAAAEQLKAAGGVAGTGELGMLGTIGTKVTAAAYGIYDIIANFGKSSPARGAMSGMTAGAAIGSFFPGGTLIGAGIGALVGGIAGLFHTGKHKDQIARDTVRDFMIGNGIIDNKWTIGLADGSRYDIGIDGGPRAAFGGLRPYEVDFKRPIAGEVVGLVQPLAMLLTGGDPKLSSDFAGYFANAAMSNAGDNLEVARQNALAIFKQMKVTPEQLVSGLAKLAESGAFSKEHLAAYLNGIKTLLSEKALAQPSGVKVLGGDKGIKEKDKISQ